MENTYLLYDDTKEAVIFDPGCYEDYEKEELKSFVLDNQLTVKHLYNTHCHIDHVFGNQFIIDEFKIPFSIHKADLETLRAVKAYAPNYGFMHYQEAEPDGFLEEGDVITFGNSSLEVLFLPGHAPGHVAFISKEQNFCISGDVLFDGSIGRTDLPGGDFDTLIKSIQNKLFKLDSEMVVYSGHGNDTTLEKEMKTNPFCAVSQ